MIIKETYVSSNDKIHKLRVKIYLPQQEPVGIFGITHGMTEHIDRYDRFMRDIAQCGYIVYGHNHLGHKDSVSDDSELGYISSEGGWELLCRDTATVYEYIKSEYGPLPHILLGHSMGSFVARLTAQKYLSPDKLILMGTSGPNPLAPIGLLLIKLIKTAKGERHVSKLIYDMAFGSYNKRFSDDGEHGWLTGDAQIRELYALDKYCTFKFSVSAMGDLMTMLHKSNSREWICEMSSKKTPILLVSGADDPVGEYGNGVRSVYNALKKAKADVTMRLYDGYRHEILNDTSYNEVLGDIIAFIS